MKKFIAILLVCLMIFGLYACGTKKTQSEEDKIREKIQSVVRSEAAVKCLFSYANVKLTTTTCTTIDDNGDGIYDVYGYVVIIDDYGDKYKGNFDAVVSVDESGDAKCEEFDLETPRKQ